LRVLEKPQHWWKGLLAYCQHCSALVEFEGLDDEVKVHEQGDMKDEGTLTWTCANCNNTTFASYSRMQEDSKRIKEARARKELANRKLVVTG
jgi:RNase P subunit RPR2